MGTSKFGGKYGSICGQIWVPDHDSQFAPLWTEIPLLETVGGCPNTVLSKDLNNPSQSKTKIRNWTKKTSVTGKTHNGQKKMSMRFSRYIYIYMTYFKQTDCIFLRLPRCRRFHHQKVLCTWPHKTLAGGFQDGFRTWHSNPSRNVWHSPCKKPHQVEVLTMNVTIDLRTFSNWLA